MMEMGCMKALSATPVSPLVVSSSQVSGGLSAVSWKVYLREEESMKFDTKELRSWKTLLSKSGMISFRGGPSKNLAEV
jgi:hypothetical protein